jgi:hypothetical protein
MLFYLQVLNQFYSHVQHALDGKLAYVRPVPSGRQKFFIFLKFWADLGTRLAANGLDPPI